MEIKDAVAVVTGAGAVDHDTDRAERLGQIEGLCDGLLVGDVGGREADPVAEG